MKPEDAIAQVVVQLGWTQVWVGVVLLAALQFLVALWVKARVEASIKHEYETRLKDYEFVLKKKEQAVKIAQLLADCFYDRKPDKKDYVADIWAMSLWLSPPLVCHLTEFLVGKNPDYRDPKELLIKIRKELHGPDDKLDAGQIAHVNSVLGIQPAKSP